MYEVYLVVDEIRIQPGPDISDLGGNHYCNIFFRKGYRNLIDVRIDYRNIYSVGAQSINPDYCLVENLFKHLKEPFNELMLFHFELIQMAIKNAR